MTESSDFLHEFARTRSEEAFAELVKRYVDLVYSCALLKLNGDKELAEDVVQVVFADFARMGPSFSRRVAVGSWLYRHAWFVAASISRSERRRKRREHLAMIQQQSAPERDLERFFISFGCRN